MYKEMFIFKEELVYLVFLVYEGLKMVSEKVKAILEWTTTNFPKNGFKASFMSLINVLGALVKQNGMTIHSNNPFFVLNVVFHSSP